MTDTEKAIEALHRVQIICSGYNSVAYAVVAPDLDTILAALKSQQKPCERVREALEALSILEMELICLGKIQVANSIGTIRAYIQQSEDKLELAKGALEKALISHENLYKQHWGEYADPMDDCVYRDIVKALKQIGGETPMKNVPYADGTPSREWE